MCMWRLTITESIQSEAITHNGIMNFRTKIRIAYANFDLLKLLLLVLSFETAVGVNYRYRHHHHK